MMIPGVIAFHLYGPGLSSIDLAFPQLIRDLFPTWLMGFFLAVLLGAVFSSFNSLLNSAATLFCLDIYTPLKKGNVTEKQSVNVAMIASVVIAVFSFLVAPLLYFAPEGLWQIIRIFTGFYNIPIVTIVIVGLFTKRTPAIGAKLVIIFHVIAYGLLKFVFADVVTLHFLHLYAILFAIEVSIMLIAGKLSPREFKQNQKVNLTPWTYAIPTAALLFSSVVAVYLLFSPLGLSAVNPSLSFYVIITALGLGNVFLWLKAFRGKPN